ncbi:MAG: hypothetical protein RL651_719 [Pseudomonadota bacterium]|jgi:uncharacterized repeat protein (TIGR03837 family)
MNDQKRPSQHWDIFCRVIDNFGDAGVCWRLAADLANRGERLRLFIDQPDILAKLIGNSSTASSVNVHLWPKDESCFTVDDIADVVIEAFACDIPAGYLQAMNEVSKPLIWINLEYLSAESWVENHHGMPSPHPRLALTKHFYFPGFTSRTGGLLREPLFTALFQPGESPEGTDLATPIKIFLFCYEQPAITHWLETFRIGSNAITLSVTPCPARLQIDAWLLSQTDHKNLEIESLEFVAQHDFDTLLSRFDVLFVRGEDSFVRAQWAGKPLVWHIYPQEEDAHLVKLQAFYDRYLGLGILSTAERSIVWQFVLAWNTGHTRASADMLAGLWPQLVAILPALHENALAWRQQLLQQPDLVTQLKDFVRHLVKSRV